MKQERTRQSVAMNWLDGCLRLVIAIQCIGLGGRYLFSNQERESDIFEWLFFDWQWPESLAQMIDNVGVWLTVLAGIFLCIMGWVRHRMDRHAPSYSSLNWIDQAAAIWIAFWMMTITGAHMVRATLWAELTLAEDAVRYAAPCALMMLIRSGVPPRRVDIDRSWAAHVTLVQGLLVVAAAATFAAHGYKAVMRYGPFTDLILLSDLGWTKFALTQTSAESMLVIIGVIDLFAAFLLIATRWRSVAFYMAVWGIIAAASRMTAYGMNAWPETLLRAANGGVPLALLGYWQITRLARSDLKVSTTELDTSRSQGFDSL